MNKTAFRWRVFVSFLLLFSFLLSALSGIVLFLRPEGTLAAWSGWSVLGLDKKAWEALHVVAIVLFLGSALGHLVYNWRALPAYCRRGRERAAAILQKTGACRELFAALLLAGLVLAATLCRWFPASVIVDLRGMFKSGTGIIKTPPPVADAGKRTLAELCPLLGVNETRLLAAARIAGIRVDSLAQTLEDVANQNGLSPEELYILLGDKSAVNPSGK